MIELVSDSPTIICIGPGGVGKTTTSAALGIALARSGKRVCILTIDPARRLASALGISLDSQESVSVLAPGTGNRLFATMLDAHATFDTMIERYAKSPEQVSAIKNNPVYHNMVTRLSGTQEYMAFERLWELRQTGQYDTIVVDTPPAEAAIDFIHAPARLAGFLDNRMFRLLLKPPPFYLRPVSFALKSLIKQVSGVVGAQVVSDTINFFESFAGIEEGFRERAEETGRLLLAPETAYVMVTSPRPGPLRTAQAIAQSLATTGHEMRAVVLNRTTPDFSSLPHAISSTPELSRLVTHLSLQREGDVARAQQAFPSEALLTLIDEIDEDVASIGALDRLADALALASAR